MSIAPTLPPGPPICVVSNEVNAWTWVWMSLGIAAVVFTIIVVIIARVKYSDAYDDDGDFNMAGNVSARRKKNGRKKRRNFS